MRLAIPSRMQFLHPAFRARRGRVDRCLFRPSGPLRMRGRSCLTSLLLWGFALCFSSSQSIAEDSIAAFYKGKQITIAVGTPAGSSASLYSQALARHMRRYLPGSPTFIVQHMPGAGGFLAANTAYNMAPRDGTFLVTTNRTVPI